MQRKDGDGMTEYVSDDEFRALLHDCWLYGWDIVVGWRRMRHNLENGS